MIRFRLLACVTVAALLTAVGSASASMLIDRNTRHQSIKVNKAGIAQVTFRGGAKGGKHVSKIIYWGAINNKLQFKYDRSNGWKSHKIDPKAKFKNACRKYRGPELPFVVASCTMKKGDNWVLQSWPRVINNYGGTNGPKELRLSHFTGKAPVIWAKVDWSWSGMWSHLYGQYTYRGKPVTANAVNSRGAVLDHVGRNLSIDSFDSDYPGTQGQWARVNAFLSNKPNGQFCFGFTKKSDARLPDPLWRNGNAYTGKSMDPIPHYRASVAGPGVAPDVQTYFDGYPTADFEVADFSSVSGSRYNDAGRAADAVANAETEALAPDGTGGSCANIN